MSKTLYPDIQKYVPEGRVHYCANGILGNGERKTVNGGGRESECVRGKEGVRKNEGERDWEREAESEIVEILFLSNLIESKGVFVLLEACSLLKNKKVHFHCTFVGGVGDVTETKFLENVKLLALDDQVDYAGKKFGEEKETAFSNADIFVHPSYNDCFPLVLLEAMQHSLPIVSTFEGAISEIVDDGINGFLVPQKDAKSLAEKLEILISNPQLRQQMGKAGRRKYENEFTIEKFENWMVVILNSL